MNKLMGLILAIALVMMSNVTALANGPTNANSLHQEYVLTQVNANISDNAKIKNAVDTYFQLELEARKINALPYMRYLFDSSHKKVKFCKKRNWSITISAAW